MQLLEKNPQDLMPDFLNYFVKGGVLVLAGTELIFISVAAVFWI